MWPLIAHQLDNARKLARMDSGRPREASLRRAVSTAYYALFQALCETCASELVGWGKPWESFTPVFRALDHGPTSDILKNFARTSPADLARLHVAFNDLKAAREWADYNPEPRPNYEQGKRDSTFTRGETLALIELAEQAIAILDRQDKPTKLRLATRLVTKSKK